MESSVLFHAQEKLDRNHLIMSIYAVPDEKKPTYKGRMKTVLSRFLSCPGSHINSPQMTFLG